MTEHLEAPQLCEGAERLGETPQSPTIVENIIQHELLEAPCELPEGLDVELGSDDEGAHDDERVQQAGGDDRVPQRVPEGLLKQPVLGTTNPKFG
jgi:hypothetical protein